MMNSSDKPEINPQMMRSLTSMLHNAQVPLDRLGTLAWVPEVMCFRLSLCDDEKQHREFAALVSDEKVMFGIHATGSQQVSQILAQGFSSSVYSFGSSVDETTDQYINTWQWVRIAKQAVHSKCNVMVEIRWHGKCVKLVPCGPRFGNLELLSPFIKPGQFVHFDSSRYCTAKEDVIIKALWFVNDLNYTVSARFAISGESVQLPDGTQWSAACSGPNGICILQLSLATFLGQMHDHANVCCANIELSYIGKTMFRWRLDTRLSAAEVFGTDMEPQVDVLIFASAERDTRKCRSSKTTNFIALLNAQFG